MIYPWKLNFWQSGEWQVCNENLKALEKAGITYNPGRRYLFEALRRTPPGDVRVAILGQDPYPDERYATGLAFSIPGHFDNTQFPPTLQTIFREYTRDLGLSFPSHGDLSQWAAQGVLLWNAIPTCRNGRSLSHDWDEYTWLTREVVSRLSEKGVVFCFLGAVARKYLEYVDLTKNEVIITSHPSPRGSRFSKTPFEGSRLFSTINDKLNAQGLEPIDWRLHDLRKARDNATNLSPLGSSNSSDHGGSDLVGFPPRILHNITGTSCGTLRDARGNVISE